MNNKGMTVIEMVVTFSLTALVVTLLLQLLISLNKLQNSSGIKTMLLTKQANITKAMYKDLEYNEILLIETDNVTYNSATLTLSDGSKREIKIDNGENKKIIYNNKVYKYPDNTLISNLKVEDIVASDVDLGIPNSFVKISIDVTYPNLSGSYGINIILPTMVSKEISYKYYEGTVVYYDPINKGICSNYHSDNSFNGYNGSNSTTGNQNSCLKWYTFIDNDASKINLLLDHNTTNNVYFNESGNVSSGPITALNKLNEDTSSWTLSRNDEFTYTLNDGNGYTFNYTGYKARLITADEIANIVGASSVLKFNASKVYADTPTDLNTQSSWFYLDGTGVNYSSSNGWKKQVSTSKGESKYKWLFNNTNNCESYGCDNNSNSNGFLTFSAVSGTSSSWVINNEGKLTTNQLGNNNYGIRPVITLDKTDLNISLRQDYE